MKTTATIIVLFLLCISRSNSQTLFPLNSGDKWIYWDYPGVFMETDNVGTTAMPNGKEYYEFYQLGSVSSFYRQEGDSVFIFDNYLNDEYLIFDFSASPGDTVTNMLYSGPGDTLRVILESKSSYQIFGVMRENWTFFKDQTGLLDDEINLTVTDSLGITKRQSMWFNWNLSGAIIAGKIYGIITHVDGADESVYDFKLEQNYPNPFNPITKIKFDIPDNTGNDLKNVKLTVYDALGREAAVLFNGTQRVGSYEVEFDAGGMSSGIYFCCLQAGDFLQIRKMTLLK